MTCITRGVTSRDRLRSEAEKQQSCCCMWSDHWLLPVVNNSQRTMGRVGFNLSDYKKYATIFSMATQTPLQTHQKSDNITIKYLKHQRQLNPSPGLPKNKSVPTPRANVSWEQRPTLGVEFILPVSRIKSAEKQAKQFKFAER